ncbi:hypothetical protein CERSUDRAFT_98598 [Gelatoporia subvermispora B]|uniref:BTB domain-containing protein n=1 Tax=Ceriporiopsis subvermispora (strain B) TaxID=914234 RepID=M2QMW0_CERS8|nr:hypothetical protein CERSUDRAFT_98598 [Gelatoporia subvermispora B]
MPPPTSPEEMDEMQDGLPVITLPEHSQTLDKLFRIVYLIQGPSLEGLEETNLVLGAATKYIMESAKDFCIKALMEPKVVEREPLRIFAIAYDHGLEDEARTAAKQFLSQDILIQHVGGQPAPPQELDGVPSTVLYRPFEYVFLSRRYAQFTIADVRWWEEYNEACEIRYGRCDWNSRSMRLRASGMTKKYYEDHRQMAYEVIKDKPCGSPDLPRILTDRVLSHMDWTEYDGCKCCKVILMQTLANFNVELFDMVWKDVEDMIQLAL